MCLSNSDESYNYIFGMQDELAHSCVVVTLSSPALQSSFTVNNIEKGWSLEPTQGRKPRGNSESISSVHDGTCEASMK